MFLRPDERTVPVSKIASICTTFDRACSFWAMFDTAEERMALIAEYPNIRKLLENYGSYMVMYSQPVNSNPQTPLEAIDGQSVLTGLRLRPIRANGGIVDMILDGWGTFGGLSDLLVANKIEIDVERVIGRTISELVESVAGTDLLIKILRRYDDLSAGPVDDRFTAIHKLTDPKDIAVRTLTRELIEELLLEDGFDADERTKLEQVRDILSDVEIFDTGARDWHYALNIYKGEGKVFLVRPIALYRDGSDGMLADLAAKGEAKLESHMPLFVKNRLSMAGKEMMGWTMRPTLEILQRWGKLGGDFTDKLTGRDLSHDLRYPHEWACKGLKLIVDQLKTFDNGRSLMSNLEEIVIKAQEDILEKAKLHDGSYDLSKVYNIDFLGAAGQMCGIPPRSFHELHEWDDKYGLPHGGFLKLHEICQDILLKNGLMPTHFYADPNDADAAHKVAMVKANKHGFVTIEGEQFRKPVADTPYYSPMLQLGMAQLRM